MKMYKLSYHKKFYKHLVCFKHHNHAMDLKLGFKAGEEDQYATNFRLGLKTKKKIIDINYLIIVPTKIRILIFFLLSNMD